jgi:hypothetical protein
MIRSIKLIGNIPELTPDETKVEPLQNFDCSVYINGELATNIKSINIEADACAPVLGKPRVLVTLGVYVEDLEFELEDVPPETIKLKGLPLEDPSRVLGFRLPLEHLN